MLDEHGIDRADAVSTLPSGPAAAELHEVYEPSVDEVTWGAARTSSWSPSDARTCATITAGAIGEFGLQRPGED